MKGLIRARLSGSRRNQCGKGVLETGGAIAGAVATVVSGIDCVAGSKLGCAAAPAMAGLTALSTDAAVGSLDRALTDQESDEGQRVVDSFYQETYQEDTLAN